MHNIYKKTALVLAIASITACSQYKQETNTNTQDNDNKHEVELVELEELDKVIVTSSHISSRISSQKTLPKKAKLPRTRLPTLGTNQPEVKSNLVGHSRGAAESLAYYPTTQPISIPTTNTENYNHFKDNQVKLVQNDPVSTFSIDVDTGAYSNVRRMLNQGIVPPHNAIRVEEFINYFNYDYPSPNTTEQPFSITTELAPSPWNQDTKLLHIGIQGYEVDNTQRPATNLVFLVDVSGSMNSPNKLGLLKSSFKLLTKNLTKNDKVAIVVYAGAAGTVLDSTAGDKKSKILQALNKLNAGGSTNGSAGINLAYQIAEENFIKDGVNRVIIATDGDFNVGTTNFEQLKELAEQKRETGVSLTTLGFGSGNYNDALMEQLADAGNGNYAYIDTLKEANKVLVEEMSSTLMTIAKDVKIQIEFNPLIVSQYRLIGYENRILNNEDFNNDKIDAGEIGAGHTVTALYEIVLNGDQGWIEPLKYQSTDESKPYSNELATLKVRYKQPDSNTSKLIVNTINNKHIISDIANTSNNFKLSAAVAGFGQLLRGGKMTQNFSYDDIKNLAKQTIKDDDFGYRGEFLQLVSLAKSLTNVQANNVE
ncbi:Putative von Willebrand factor, vWF type A domain protein STM2315 [hydrothermal vent metagenome]|uniref:von Willebrand factor, vWF type A domain protein STM2315 n=1 Tax=hydrothermal vent metagenome TaxID=652676 RepID=A0A3B0V218_9ZZZZ